MPAPRIIYTLSRRLYKLIILKYIPYSAYQVKTVNCHQPIQAPLKYFYLF